MRQFTITLASCCQADSSRPRVRLGYHFPFLTAKSKAIGRAHDIRAYINEHPRFGPESKIVPVGKKLAMSWRSFRIGGLN